MSLEYQSKLNQLLVLGKKNGLFFSDWLRKNGYSDQLIRKYRQSGWLATLDKGVMYRTGDSLSSFAALSCYNEQLNKKARVAAHSALELFGFNHYVPMGKPLLMVAHHNSNIPKWMTSDSFDKNFKPFSTKMIDVPQTSILKPEDYERLGHRVYFICKDYNALDDEGRFYLHKSIVNLKVNQSAQNPITYLMPEIK